MIIADKILESQNFRFDAGARAAFAEYIPLRRGQEHFANARSIRNAIDRMRLRLANRIFSADHPVTREDLMTLTEADVRASRVYAGGLTAQGAVKESP